MVDLKASFNLRFNALMMAIHFFGKTEHGMGKEILAKKKEHLMYLNTIDEALAISKFDFLLTVLCCVVIFTFYCLFIA